MTWGLMLTEHRQTFPSCRLSISPLGPTKWVDTKLNQGVQRGCLTVIRRNYNIQLYSVDWNPILGVFPSITNDRIAVNYTTIVLQCQFISYLWFVPTDIQIWHKMGGITCMQWYYIPFKYGMSSVWYTPFTNWCQDCTKLMECHNKLNNHDQWMDMSIILYVKHCKTL